MRNVLYFRQKKQYDTINLYVLIFSTLKWSLRAFSDENALRTICYGAPTRKSGNLNYEFWQRIESEIVTVKRDRRQEKVRKLGSAMAESPEGLRKRLQELDSMLQSSDMAAESAAQAQVPRRPFLA